MGRRHGEFPTWNTCLKIQNWDQAGRSAETRVSCWRIESLESLVGDEATGLAVRRRVESSEPRSCILPLFKAGIDYAEVEKLIDTSDLLTAQSGDATANFYWIR